MSASLATANITSLKDALGRTTSYTWNDRFLLQSATLPDQTKLKYNYDYGNRLQSLVDGNGVQMAVSYDERGNLQQFVNGQGQSIVYRYGHDNRMANMTDALGHRHQYQYDAAGNMVGTTDALGQSERIISNAQGAPVSFLSFGLIGQGMLCITITNCACSFLQLQAPAPINRGFRWRRSI